MTTAWASSISYHYEQAKEYVQNPDLIIGAFAYGSQNYGLSTSKSDFDSKVIVVPSQQDIIYGKQCVSTQHILLNNEHMHVCDVRRFIGYLKAMHPNFLEVLWTDYRFINLLHTETFNKLLSERESLSRYDEAAFYRTVVSMYLCSTS